MPVISRVGLQNKVTVGLAEMAVSNNQDVLLIASSLGSCLGLAAYDPQVHVSGLLHAMLPDSAISPAKAALYPAMFVDTGLTALLGAMQRMGAAAERSLLFVAGGAQVLDSSGSFNLGTRNHEALAQLLQQLGLRACAQEIGGLLNRSLFLNVAKGEVRVKVSGQDLDIILCKNWTII
ncbi:MAG: chemotaxis protein CheD [Verrucomicrobiota bacterium]|mgnify:FL=1